MKRTILACLLALTACGGSSKSATPVADPAPMTEPTTETKPEEPTEPTPAEEAAKQEPPAPDPKAELLAAEMVAYDKAKPVFEKWCAKCHSQTGKATSDKKRKEFDMTTYPFGGEHADEMGEEVREVLGLTGKKPTMPADKKGAVKGEDLELLKAWSEAFDASHKGGAHAGHAGH